MTQTDAAAPTRTVIIKPRAQAPAPAVTIEPYGPVELCIDRELWERQPEESDRSWMAFQMFRDLPSGTRTVRQSWFGYLRALGRFNPKKHEKASPASWFNSMVTHFKWIERAVAYDAYVDRVAYEAIAQRRIRARLEASDLGTEIMKKASEAARALQTTLYQAVLDGKGQKTIVLRSALSASDIARLAKVGKELRWAALGLEERTQLGLQVNVNVAPTLLTDNEVVDQAQEILQARSDVIDGEVINQADGPARAA